MASRTVSNLKRASRSVVLALVACGPCALVAGAAASQPDVPAGWLATVTEHIARSEYRFALRPDGSYAAPNRAHGLRVGLSDTGLRLAPRGGRDEAPAWTLGLRLTGFGRDGSLADPGTLLPIAEENRAEFRRDRLDEAYVNDSRGLEQTFTLRRPPSDASETLPVVLELSIEGDVSAFPSEDGGEVLFKTASGAAVVRYGELRVSDARGGEVPARLEVRGRALRIVVDDRGASYPLRVDPLMTSPSWTVTGDQANSRFGFSVSTAGDVNGDGFSDVIVGASLYDAGQTDEGRAFVYLGSASGLSTSPAWTAEGNLDSAEFGCSVSTAGDVNGDGYDDVIVGADHYHAGQTDEGRAYVFLGSASGMFSSPVWTGESDTAGALFGHSVATAGDVNGDGYADVIVGAPGTQPTTQGRAYVYLGSTGGLSTAPAWTGQSDQTDSAYGTSVASALDTNGDGYDDVIVGADLYDVTSGGEGKAFVYLGGPGGVAALHAWTALGNGGGASFGYTVAPAGDVDGDGFADVLVAAPLETTSSFKEGKVYLFRGSATGPLATAGWTATETQQLSGFGNGLATAGDVNGDGYADVVVGAPNYSGAAADGGRAYLFLGSAAGLSASPPWTFDGAYASGALGMTVATAGDVNGDGYSDVVVGSSGQAQALLGSGDRPLTTSGWTLTGASYSGFATQVASAGDVNGDGYSDVIVGSPAETHGESGEGRAYLYLGSPNGPSTTPSWTAEGNQANARFGQSVASAGDVNGDGYDDVIVGASDYQHPVASEGRAFVYLGGPTGLGTMAAWTAESDQANAKFGYSVASAGDVNGDGYGDVIVGAPYFTNTLSEEGRAYVYLGGPSGLAASPAWFKDGGQAGAGFGYSVAAAGDVDRDGYGDVIVGAYTFNAPLLAHGGKAEVYRGSPSGPLSSASWTDDGGVRNVFYLGISDASAGDVNGDGYSDIIVGSADRAFVYHGSASGPSLTPDWTGTGVPGDVFGISVASAGDVNGDGYSDIVIGAYLYNNGNPFEGAVSMYLGSATGPALSPSWFLESNDTDAEFGNSVASAGDVNGDGFADMLAAAWNSPAGDRVRLFYGDATRGLDRAPRQVRADGSAPIAGYGKSDSEAACRLGALGRAPAGRAQVKLEWEVKPLGTPFDGTVLTRSAAFLDTGFPDLGQGSASALDERVSGLAASTAYRWRSRVVSTSPFFPHSPWLSPPFNARTETDLRTAAAAAPFVTSVSPPENSENQSQGASVVVTFSEALLSASVTPSTVRLLEPGSNPVAAAVSLSSSGREVTIDLAASLFPLTRYAVQVTSAVQDLASIAAVPFASHFTTDNSGPGGTPLANVSNPSDPPPSPTSAKIGSSVAGAGDLNLDGAQDFVAGAPGYAVGGNVEAGAAIVYLGSTSASERQSPDIIFTGEAAHDRAGVSVSSNFDFNGDGIPDILIGAEQVNRTVYPGDPIAPGKVYLIYFDPTDTTHYPNLANPSVSDTVSLSLVGQPGGIPGVVFTGVALGDQAGFAVSGRGWPGDPMWPGNPVYPVDPIKYAAITIGASGRSYPTDPVGGRGAAYVIWPGDPTTPLSGTISLSRVANGQGDQIGGVIYNGAAPGDRLGFAVTLTGDLTGASGDDIVLAAPYADTVIDATTETDAGAVYVAGGGSLAPATVNVADIGVTVNGTQILGDHAGILLGYSVASAGLKRAFPGQPIITGDPWRAHVDLLMGAPLFNLPMPLGPARASSSTSAASAGAVFQSAKKLPGGIVQVCSIGGGHPELPPLPGTVWTGANAGDQLGYAVAILGDVNANGTDDYAFGTPFADPNTLTDAGTVYLVDGAAVPATVNGMVDIGTVGTTTPGIELVGVQAGENAGSALAGTGDLNGGGSPDLVAGAPGRDVSSGTDAGTVYQVVLDDQDGDGTKDGQDCAPGNAQVWSLPGEAEAPALPHDRLTGITTIIWSAPVTIGGVPSSILYDTLRSTSPSSFTASAICLETGGADTTSSDAQSPPSGQVFYYLVRGTNACGGGALGTGPGGAPRTARSCP
jgi:hypothetical protein